MRSIMLSMTAVLFAAMPLDRSAAQTAPEPQAPTVTLPDSAVEIDKEAVREELERQGYSSITELTREGDVFTASAERYGETVEVRVDALTRLVLEPQRLTREQIRNKLESEGYADVRDLARDTNVPVYTATADKDGQVVALQIDPTRGEVMLETPAGE